MGTTTKTRETPIKIITKSNPVTPKVAGSIPNNANIGSITLPLTNWVMSDMWTPKLPAMTVKRKPNSPTQVYTVAMALFFQRFSPYFDLKPTKMIQSSVAKMKNMTLFSPKMLVVINSVGQT